MNNKIKRGSFFESYNIHQLNNNKKFLERFPAFIKNNNQVWIGDLQQGDGGKGAVVDRLAESFDVVIRCQGGNNAGHTVSFTNKENEKKEIKSHILPASLRHDHIWGLLSNGVVLNPEQLKLELEKLKIFNKNIENKIIVSSKAHIIFPFHIYADKKIEKKKSETGTKIGTTLRGIGPCNISKTARLGIRIFDLYDMKLVKQRLCENISFFNLPKEMVDYNFDWIQKHRDFLLKHSYNSLEFMRLAQNNDYSLLFEGAQGALLDIEHGTYPYVTTSPTLSYSVFSGSGFDNALNNLKRYAVLKTYQTMVGNGPFVTEQHGNLLDFFREKGNEYGTTTKRNRRCGWLDLVSAKWAAKMNNIDGLILTKIDVLSGLKEIKVCVGYKCKNSITYDYVPENYFLGGCEPIYKTFRGFNDKIGHIKEMTKLPGAVKQLFEFIEQYIERKIVAVSNGPDKENMILTKASPLKKLIKK